MADSEGACPRGRVQTKLGAARDAADSWKLSARSGWRSGAMYGASSVGAVMRDQPSSSELLTNYGGDALPVGAALHLRHDERHDLAHVLRRGRPRLRHGVAHDRVQLLVGELLGHVLLDDRRLAALAVGEVVAAGVGVGLRGLQAALALALENGGLVAVGLLLRGLLELVRDQAQSLNALLVTGLQRHGGIGLHLVDQGHRSSVGCLRNATAARAAGG